MASVREKIEGLPPYHHRFFGYEYDTINRADVLSLLDEHLGECVMEEVVPDHQVDWGGVRVIARKMAMMVYDYSPGDRISIYVRRKK